MSRTARILSLAVLPLVTLILGWNLGARFQEQSVLGEEREWESIGHGNVGSGSVVTQPEKEVDLTLLWMTWDLLLKNYIEPTELTGQKLFFGAIHGLVEAVGDPYTTFFTPAEDKQFRSSLNGSLEGIGAELTVRKGYVVVVAPLRGSPAEQAGLKPDDVITHVDEKDIEGLPLSQVVGLIRGEKGTRVTLTIQRVTQTKEITITRDKITVPSIRSELREEGDQTIGVASLIRFGDETLDELIKALKEFQEKDIDGLVIDLRYNGGGYLEGAISVTSLFLDKGEVVSVERREGEPIRHYVSGRPLLPNIPLVILINKGSASASEIVAGALQDHDRALIVGEKSFGKGTVQEVFDLPGESSIRVTVAHWLTPNGRNLGKEGVEPDIKVELTEEDFEEDRDPQLDEAIRQLVEHEE